MSDWHSEINWGYLRALVAAHFVLWSYGLFLWAYASGDGLSGRFGRLLAVVSLAGWAGSLLGLFPLVRSMREGEKGGTLSTQSWVLLGGFLVSSLGFLCLLLQLDLGRVLFWE